MWKNIGGRRHVELVIVSLTFANCFKIRAKEKKLHGMYDILSILL